MKKMITVMMMLVMLCAGSMTVCAANSPSSTPTTEAPAQAVSPKTGESDIVLYGMGMTAVVCAAGAVVIRKKTVA